MNATQFARKIDEILRRLDQLEATAHINYDKGAYVPTYLGGTTAGATTYTFQTGAWVWLGSLLFVRGQVAWSAATGTGNAQILLPFAPASGNFSGSLYLNGVTFAAGAPEMLISGGNTFFTMGSPASNAGPTVVAVEAAGNAIWTCLYTVA